MAINLAESGAAAWYNPAWLFLNAFHRIFLRISQGASRLQEVRADRVGCLCLRRRDVRGRTSPCHSPQWFSSQFRVENASLRHAIDLHLPVKNLYGGATPDPAREKQISGAVEDAVHAKPSP
jgi:hypothetical protein